MTSFTALISRLISWNASFRNVLRNILKYTTICTSVYLRITIEYSNSITEEVPLLAATNNNIKLK